VLSGCIRATIDKGSRKITVFYYSPATRGGFYYFAASLTQRLQGRIQGRGKEFFNHLMHGGEEGGGL